MAITVNQAWSHALAAFKLPSNAFTAEEVRSANDVQSHLTSFHLWHWTLTAGATIATVVGTQDYTMVAADQNRVGVIAAANLLEGTAEQPDLQAYSWRILPRHTTQGQPTAVCLISPTRLRFFPVPDAVYTFQWTYYINPTVFTVNTGNYQCPDNFEHAILQGNIWKLAQLLDDDRQDKLKEEFYRELSQLRSYENKTAGRQRI